MTPDDRKRTRALSLLESWRDTYATYKDGRPRVIVNGLQKETLAAHGAAIKWGTRRGWVSTPTGNVTDVVVTLRVYCIAYPGCMLHIPRLAILVAS